MSLLPPNAGATMSSESKRRRQHNSSNTTTTTTKLVELSICTVALSNSVHTRYSVQLVYKYDVLFPACSQIISNIPKKKCYITFILLFAAFEVCCYRPEPSCSVPRP